MTESTNDSEDVVVLPEKEDQETVEETQGTDTPTDDDKTQVVETPETPAPPTPPAPPAPPAAKKAKKRRGMLCCVAPVDEIEGDEIEGPTNESEDIMVLPDKDGAKTIRFAEIEGTDSATNSNPDTSHMESRLGNGDVVKGDVN